MSYGIESYTFVKGLKTLGSSDFHTDENTQGTSISVFNQRTSYIKGSLKFLKSPSAILFYYNNTDNVFLTNWVQAKVISETNGSEVIYYHVNLDYEIDLRDTFENMEESNPFFWTKIPPGNNKPFVLFYLDTYPQFTYNGTFNKFILEEYFTEYQGKVDNSDMFRNKFYRKEISENKTGYYKSLVDDDFSNIPGVSIFLQDYLGTTKVQLLNYKTSFGNIYQYNKTYENGKYSLDLVSINDKNDIISLKNIGISGMGYFREIDLDQEKEERSEIYKLIMEDTRSVNPNDSFVLNKDIINIDILNGISKYLKNTN